MDPNERYTPALYDSKLDIIVVFDPELGDYVTRQEYRERRIWSHLCKSGVSYRFTLVVQECDKCGEKRPEMPRKG